MTTQEPSREFDDIPDPAGHAVDQTSLAPQTPAEPSPTRADRRLRGAIAIAASLAWIGAIAVRVGFRPDLMAARVLMPLCAWAAVGLAGLFVLLKPSARGLPRNVTAVRIIVVLVVVAFAGLAVALSGPEGGLQATACLTVSILMAAGPLALAAMFLHRSSVSAPAWRGAAMGAICGLAGTVGIHAHCPYAAMGHVLIAHGLPILVGAAFGAAWSRARGRI